MSRGARLGLGGALLALLFASLQLDLPVALGRFTLYHNELLLALLLPYAALSAWRDPARRGELKLWSLAFAPLGLWLLLHALGPDSPWDGAKAALRGAEFACGLALPTLLLSGRAELGALLKWAFALLALSCLWALLQTLLGPAASINAGRGAEYMDGFQAGAAGFGHHNQLAAFLVAALCLALASWLAGLQKGWALMAIFATLLGLVSTFSRGAWLMAMLVALCFLPALPRRLRLALACLALAALLALMLGPFAALRLRAGNLFSDSDRAEHLRAAWGLWQGHAWWGWGAQGLDAQAKAVASTMTNLSPGGREAFSSHMHNTWLQIGLSWGWPALLGWMAYFAPAMKRALLALKDPGLRPWGLGLGAAMLAFAAQGMTDVLILHARGLALSLCWGLMLAGLRFQEAADAP